MMQKTKIVQVIMKYFLLMSNSLKRLFNLNDVFGDEKCWFKNGMKNNSIFSAFMNRLDFGLEALPEVIVK
jgi:hypothetical protein